MYLNKMTVEKVSSPCKPETISTTSSYTIRVAVRSGSRSRLMEENTGTHTHTRKHTQTYHKQIFLVTLVIIVRQNNR